MKVEEEYEEKKRRCEVLEEELNSLKEECTKTEHNLTTEIGELQPYSEQLKVSGDLYIYCVVLTFMLRLKLKRSRSS